MTTQNRNYESIVRAIGSKRLDEIRTNSGLSREELAERIGKSLSGYSNYEAGRRELPQSARLAIMDSLGVDPLSTEALQSALTVDIIPEPKTPQHILHTSAEDHLERHELRTTTTIIQSKSGSTGLIRAARLYICKIRSWRQSLIAQSERFFEEIYSALARRQIRIEDNLLAAVTIYTWLHLQAFSLDRAYLVPVGKDEWGLLLMFALILILLPRQAFRMFKFYRWRRVTGQPTQQGMAPPSQDQRQNL